MNKGDFQQINMDFEFVYSYMMSVNYDTLLNTLDVFRGNRTLPKYFEPLNNFTWYEPEYVVGYNDTDATDEDAAEVVSSSASRSPELDWLDE